MNRFDTLAQSWDANPTHVERTRAIADGLRRRIPLSTDLRALEVGAGTGLLSLELHRELGPITLTDTSEGMLAVLREKIAAHGIPNMTPRQLDLTRDALPAGSFDLIYLQMVLHHIDDVDGLLRTFHDLLAPGGHLAIADLVAEDGSFHGEGFEGHHGFDTARLGTQLTAAGFSLIGSDIVYAIQRETREAPYPIFLLTARRG